MDAEKRIVNKYRSRGVMRGQELLLQPADALHFIEDCEQLGLTILGMDFYKQEGEHIIQLPNSADYSSLSGQKDAVKRGATAAQQLIRGGLPGGASWVSFVVE